MFSSSIWILSPATFLFLVSLPFLLFSLSFERKLCFFLPVSLSFWVFYNLLFLSCDFSFLFQYLLQFFFNPPFLRKFASFYPSCFLYLGSVLRLLPSFPLLFLPSLFLSISLPFLNFILHSYVNFLLFTYLIFSTLCQWFVLSFLLSLSSFLPPFLYYRLSCIILSSRNAL